MNKVFQSLDFGKKRIIIFLFLAQVFSDISLINPIRFAFMQSNGADISTIGYLKSLFLFTIFLFEIPTGFIADRFGRRNSIILSFLFSLFHFLCIIFVPNIFGFLLSQFFLGISATFISGADSAYLKDLILDDEKQGRISYLELRSLMSMGSKIISIIMSFVSGYLYEWYSILPFGLSSVLCLLSIIIMFFLPEVNGVLFEDKKIKGSYNFFGDFYSTLVKSMVTFLSDVKMRKLVLLDALFMSGIVYIFESYQFVFRENGIDEIYF